MGSWQTSSLDIPLWLQSNGNPTPAKFSEREQQKDGFPSWLSGKEMSETLTHPNTPEAWTAFMRDSLVKTLALLESKLVSAKEPALGFTEKSCELLAQLDRDTSSWKMSPQLKATDLKRLSKTWPSWGMTLDGCVYEHLMSGRRITETGGLRYVMPTPTAAMEAPNKRANTKGPKNLVEIAQGKWDHLWPTPCARDWKDNGKSPSELKRNTPSLATLTGGKLNPQWVEWLMGWPIDHTALKQSETVKSRSKLRQRLPFWLRSK